jgi:uncharacterized protein (TIGR02058 family)
LKTLDRRKSIASCSNGEYSQPHALIRTLTFSALPGFGADAHGQNSTKAAGKIASGPQPLLLPKLACHPLNLLTQVFFWCFFLWSVRACRNAIEFNQIPGIGDLVPGGRDAMKLDVLVAVPEAYRDELDISAVKAAFPYGNIRLQIQNGGMIANSGKAIASLGDKNTDMVVVCVAVTVGY